MNAIEDSPGYVNLVLTGIVGVPSGNPLPHMKRTFDILNDNIDKIGIVVIVGKGNLSLLVNTFFDILGKATSRPIRPTYFSTSLDDALRIIEAEKEY